MNNLKFYALMLAFLELGIAASFTVGFLFGALQQ